MRGRKVCPEFGVEDTCEVSQVAGERRRFPATRVLTEAEAVLVSTETGEAGDGFLVGMYVEEATLGLDRDVAVVAEGLDSGSEPLGFSGSMFAG
jgi:hypothetical protein